MKKWMGIAVLLFAAFVLFGGWAVWSGMGEEAGTLGAARVVDAKQLADAKVGELVVLEGTAIEPTDLRLGPVSRAPAAWYRVTREHHWREEIETCSRKLTCKTHWINEHESAGVDAARSMDVRVKGSKQVLHLAVPDDETAVARLVKTTSRRYPMDVPPTPKHKGDYEVRDEYLLKPGTIVTVAGDVRGSGDKRTIERAAGLSLVYVKSRDAMLKDLHGYEKVGVIMMIISVLIAAGGISLIRRSRKGPGPSAPQIHTQQFADGTVLGGVDKPMHLDVRCQGCHAVVRLDYHDVHDRWQAASRATETKPAWQVFNLARPLAESETGIDITCTHCARPMRVIVRADEWRMSLWAFYVIELLVLVAAPSD